MDIRVRMVVLGLVIGVVVAVIVGAQGCGEHHPAKRGFHGGGGGSAAPAGSGGPGGGGGASGGGASASAAGGGGASASAPTGRGRALASAPAGRALASAPAGRASSSAPAGRASASRPLRIADPRGPFVGYRRGHMTRADAPRPSRLVALTFDDGPAAATLQIVSELRRLNARATFFVIGSMAAARPDVIKETARAGMQIANHTWSHPPMPTLSPAAQRQQIDSTNGLLRDLTGRRPRFFRPPNWRIGSRTARVLRGEQMIGVLRTVDTRDWTLPGADTIVRRALRVRPGGIVAMHDGGGYSRAQTAEAVPAIVRGLRRRHLRLVTVAELYAGRAG